MFWPTRIGRRLLTGCAAALVSVVVVVACSDQNATQPTAPEALNPEPQLDVTFTCPSQSSVDGLITNLIHTLYRAPQPSKILQAQLGKYSSFKSKLPSKTSDALKKMAELDQSILADLKQGKVNGIPSPAGENVALLIGYLACYYNYFNGTAADIPVPNLTIDGTTSVGVFVPGGTTNQTFRGPNNFSGTVLPPNAYPEALFITVEELPDEPPLLTDLDQYPKFSRFHAEPVDGSLATNDPPEDHVVTFTADVTVSLCQSGVPPDVIPFLRLAHNIYPFNFGDIEILPTTLTNPAGVICDSFAMNAGASDPASWLLGRTLPARMKEVAGILSPLARFLLPEAVNAAVVRGTTSGTTKNYSPFGAVDARIVVNRVTPDPTTAELSNGAASVTETIEVRTVGSNTLVDAAPFTFIPSQNGDGVPSTASPTTGFTGNPFSSGQATTTWSFTAAGSYSLFADVFPAKKIAVGANIEATSVAFTATVTDPTQQPPPTSGTLSFSQQPTPSTTTACTDFTVAVLTTPVASGIAVTINAVNSNGAKSNLLGVNPVSTNGSGVANFTLQITQPGGYNMIASAEGWTSATSTRLKISPPACD